MTRTTIIKNDEDQFKRAPVNAKRPTRQNSTGDVDTALFAALGVMMFIVLGYFGILLASGRDFYFRELGIVIIIASIFGLLTFIIVFMYLLKAIWAIEEVVGYDIDHDGVIGERRHPFATNTNGKQVKTDPAKQWQEDFYRYVEHLYNGGTTHHSARGAFTEEQISKYRQYCVDLGIANWKNTRSHQQGLALLKSEEETNDLLERTAWVDVAKGKRH